jgi:hypothetical protein
MNFEDIGKVIAMIKNENNQKLNKIISLEPNKNKVRDYIEEIFLDKDFETIQQMPPDKEHRLCLYITGQSGSGKSVLTFKYADEYRKKFKNNPIYLFSSVEKDILDKIKNLKRVKLDDKFLNECNIGELDYSDSLFIFDDTDVLSNKFIKKKVDQLLNILLQKGRHSASSVIYTSHQPNSGKDTKIILSESHSISFFPQTLGNRALKYLLESQFGYSTKQINNIRKKCAGSRWVTIYKPNIVMYEKGIFFVKPDDL